MESEMLEAAPLDSALSYSSSRMNFPGMLNPASEIAGPL
jgi:hypothetical protein